MTRGFLIAALALSATAATPAAPVPTKDRANAEAVRQKLNAKLTGHAASLPAAAHDEAARGPAAAPHAAPAIRTASSSPSRPHGSSAVDGDDPSLVWRELLSGNQRFADLKPRVRALGIERIALASGQHPRAIVLGCADSRVSPELVFDQSLGDLFVVRTAGNIADEVALGSMEYAVEHLGARLLVVLGHEKCGAVKAALSGEPMPSANLEAIVSRIQPATQKAKTCFDGEELVTRCVRSNVHQSARDLLAHSAILRERVEHGQLRIVEAMYHLKSGEVEALDD